jgi:hypothetical protein
MYLAQVIVELKLTQAHNILSFRLNTVLNATFLQGTYFPMLECFIKKLDKTSAVFIWRKVFNHAHINCPLLWEFG